MWPPDADRAGPASHTARQRSSRRCGSHAKGCGPTPSGRHTLPVGSHHSPSAHSAEFTAGVAIVAAAIDANATLMMGTR